jgi:hypothetical protein
MAGRVTLKLAEVLARPPLLGLVAFCTILLWRPVAHSLTMLVHELFEGPSRVSP